MKVAIIGAGLQGITCAYFLAKRGCQVVVIDRCSGAGLETSFANGGMPTPSQAGPWNEPEIFLKLLKYLGRESSPLLIRPLALPGMMHWGLQFLRNSKPQHYFRNMAANSALANYSLTIQRRLRVELPLSYDSNSNGTLKIFRRLRDFDAAREVSNQQSVHTINHRLLDGDGAVEVEPALAPIQEQLAGAIYFPDDESGDAFKFCAGLADKATQAGVEFKLETVAEALRHRNGRVTAISTSVGDIKADSYLIAAGSYSVALCKPLGINLPINPVKGYSLSIATEGWSQAPRIPVVDESLHAAVTPLGDRLRISGTAEFAGYDTRIRKSRIANLYTMLEQILPQSINLQTCAAKEWARLRPMSCDGVPLLGETRFGNLYLNTGHGHLGWSMACGSGKAVSDLIGGGEPDLDLSPYALSRFPMARFQRANFR